MPVRRLDPVTETDPADLLRGLDADQRAAVTAPTGVVVVRAGAGSGKTRVLMRRIAWRSADDASVADRTIAITFTRQAAAEMRARLREFDLDGTPVVGTIHAVARRMMHDHLDATGRKIPVIAVNRHAIMSSALDDGGRGTRVEDMLAVHDWCVSRCEGPREGLASWRDAGGRRAPSESLFAATIERYQLLKRKRGVIDVNDLLVWAVDAFESDRRFAESMRFRHRHVLVDEAQDLNPLQWHFVRLLAGSDPDLFLVGDPNQAIYAFNGADRAIFGDLPGLEAPVHGFSLPNNYRCTPEIVDFAVAALAKDNQTADAVSARMPGQPVALHRCPDEGTERERIRRTLHQFVASDGTGNDAAILVRVNSLAEKVRRQLVSLGFDVRDPRSGGAWAQALRTASSLTSRDALATWSSDILDGPDWSPEEPESVVATEVRRFLDEQRSGAVNGRAFSAWFATSSNAGDTDGIEVLTFHAAKGREWRSVLVLGAERGLLPHSSAKRAEARSEEARLAYVAFTRASDRLVVAWTDQRDGRDTGPSPFLPWLETRGVAVDAPVADFREIAARAAPGDQRLEALRNWRSHRARVAMVSPETVISDRKLREMSRLPDLTHDAIAAVAGEVFAQRFADEIVAAVDTGPA